MEAASTGDVSRKIELQSSCELGALSKALTRLFGVIERSRNLVYHLATLVELSGDAIISQNLEGKILSWNKGAQRMYGYSIEEIKGQPVDMLMPPDDRTLFRQIFEQVKKGKRPQPIEMLHQAKNGRSVQAFVHITAIYDSRKQIIGVSLCAQEMSRGRHPGRKVSVSGRRDSADWPGLTEG
jgi:PAS domain S-box-containing protein